MSAQRTAKILIIGGGCFGVSSAYHLLKRGFTNVTILDRSPTLPAPDAASNDINRIVRSSYADRYYCDLAREAIGQWKDKEKWEDSYHESGVVVLGLSGDRGPTAYAQESYANDRAAGANVIQAHSREEVRSFFPSSAPTADLEDRFVYLNRDGGWANAGKGLKLMTDRIIALGANVLEGMEVKELVYNEVGRVAGVRCANAVVHDADLVIVATGSWTPSTFPKLTLNGTCLATGQCVGMIQLTAKEVAQYQDCPVVLDFESGFYVFPPNEMGTLKVAIHSTGYTHTQNGVSTPRTITSDPVNGNAIPKRDLKALREGLRKVYPELAEKPFSTTRFCWYNDSPDGDWIISRHPSSEGIILATGGSGHAYKFLPVIGAIVADLVEDRLEPSIVAKFSIDRIPTGPDPSRKGQPRELNLAELCSDADLSLVSG